MQDLSYLISARSRAVFEIKLSLGVVDSINDPVAASLKYLRDELGKDNLPSIISFSLDDVRDLKYKKNWKPFINLRLKTISSDGEYWINSGLLIDKA